MVKKSADATVVDFPWGKIEWMVSGELQNSQSTTFGRVTIRAGMSNDFHRHPNCDEVLYVLAGTIEHHVEQERFRMDIGDAISIPSGLWHCAAALGDEDAVMLISFSSPFRETDFAP